jgi:hypothetical protein
MDKVVHPCSSGGNFGRILPGGFFNLESASLSGLPGVLSSVSADEGIIAEERTKGKD